MTRSKPKKSKAKKKHSAPGVEVVGVRLKSHTVQRLRVKAARAYLKLATFMTQKLEQIASR